MCGITGFIGKKADVAKLKLIMIANEVRGKHSCGVYYQDQALYGLNDQALASNFFIHNKLPLDPKKPIRCFLGHSRQATALGHTAANAHPFLIRKNEKNVLTVNKDEGTLVMKGVHNGRLNSLYTLRSEYPALTDKEFDLDSKVLLGALYLNKDNPGAVLEKYEGAAALLYTFDDKKLYVWKGAAGGEEERPLFYLQQPEGVYFSSLSDPLFVINDTANDVYYCGNNTLYSFTVEGEIKAKEFKREAEKGEYSYKKTNVSQTPLYNTKNRNFQTDEDEETSFAGHVDYPATNKKRYILDNYNIAPELAIKKIDAKVAHIMSSKTDIMFKDFRYYKRTADTPLTGRYLLSPVGQLDSNGKEYYFFQGIPVSPEGFMELAYHMMTQRGSLLQLLSKHSLIPLLTVKINDLARNEIIIPNFIYKNAIFSGQVTPLFIDCYYRFRDGIPVEKAKMKNANNTRTSFIVVPQNSRKKYSKSKSKASELNDLFSRSQTREEDEDANFEEIVSSHVEDLSLLGIVENNDVCYAALARALENEMDKEANELPDASPTKIKHLTKLIYGGRNE